MEPDKELLPETARVNKNREALLVFDSKEANAMAKAMAWFSLNIKKMADQEVDTIVISVKERPW